MALIKDTKWLISFEISHWQLCPSLDFHGNDKGNQSFLSQQKWTSRVISFRSQSLVTLSKSWQSHQHVNGLSTIVFHFQWKRAPKTFVSTIMHAWQISEFFWGRSLEQTLKWKTAENCLSSTRNFMWRRFYRGYRDVLLCGTDHYSVKKGL